MVQTSSKRLQFTLSLAEQSESVESASRAFSIDLPSNFDSETASVKAAAFETAYMQNYANAEGGRGKAMGSLIQATGWRDDDDNETALKCIGIKAVYIDETRYAFDEN